MTLFDSEAFEGHEAVHAFSDEDVGLRTIIAVHSTARGPAAGGCRLWPYPTSEAALEDALKLSRAMSYKNAVADIPHGGGKAVIIADPSAKMPALFEAFGRAVEQVGGRYWTAEDVGVSTADMAHVRKHTRYVAGLENHPAASGDPSPVTAEGVFRGLKLAVRRALGREDLAGLTVAVQGVGSVGAHLCDKLHAAGAKLVVTDVNEAALARVAARTGAQVVAPEAIFDVPAEVFAPCALGGAITEDALDRLSARVIAGGANNQLATREAGRRLHERGLIYAPDYVINGGGIINVAGEIRAIERGEAYDPAWVEAKLDRLMQTLDEVLARSAAENRPTEEIAGEIARARMVPPSAPQPVRAAA